MKNDLYKVLGVPSKADKKALKAAYKKAAKQSHPDMKGGDAKKFALVKKAFDILSDDERRAKYDTTGDEAEKEPDNEYASAAQVIAHFFGVVLQECAQSGESPLERDMLSAIKSKISGGIQEMQKANRIARSILDTDKKMHGRFTKKKPEGNNIFDGILSNRITMIQMQIEQNEKNIGHHKKAQELIKDFTYRSDPKPKGSEWDSPLNRFLGQAGVSYVGF